MRTFKVNAKIDLLANFNEFYNFPIINEIRCSFWFKDSKYSIFSEIRFEKAVKNDEEIYYAEITLPKIGTLEREANKGEEFSFGVFPIEIGKGVIL